MRRYFLLLALLASPLLWAEANPPSEYNHLNVLLQSGVDKTVLSREAEDYLNHHPADGDVRLMLAKIYWQQNQPELARHELHAILQDYPAYSDASLMLAKIECANGAYHKALDTVTWGLIYNPTDAELMNEERRIVTLRHTSTLASIPNIRHNTTARAPPPKPLPPEIKTLNEIGTYQQQYYISDKHAVWDYTTAYIGRHTEFGIIYAKTTYANRLNKQGVQGEFEAYPIISKNIYLDLDFAFASQPVLFPNKAYGAEAYIATPAFDYSIGARYNDINTNHHFTVFTGSVAKNYRNNRLLFRPFYFLPGKGSNSQLYTLDLRHIITDPNFYFGCIFGYGTSPDLANLNTINFIIVKNKLINPYVNFPLLNERLIIFGSVLLQNQIFTKPNPFIRNWYGGTIGLNWKY